jgi:DNA-binding FadR family transcriptional regulator
MKRLADLVASMEVEVEAARTQEMDYDFFQLLVTTTGNRLLGLIANAVRRVYLQHRGLFVALYEQGSFESRYHHQLLFALRDRDPQRARAAMEEYGRLALNLVSAA